MTVAISLQGLPASVHVHAETLLRWIIIYDNFEDGYIQCKNMDTWYIATMIIAKLTCFMREGNFFLGHYVWCKLFWQIDTRRKLFDVINCNNDPCKVNLVYSWLLPGVYCNNQQCNDPCKVDLMYEGGEESILGSLQVKFFHLRIICWNIISKRIQPPYHGYTGCIWKMLIELWAH